MRLYMSKMRLDACAMLCYAIFRCVSFSISYNNLQVAFVWFIMYYARNINGICTKNAILARENIPFGPSLLLLASCAIIHNSLRPGPRTSALTLTMPVGLLDLHKLQLQRNKRLSSRNWRWISGRSYNHSQPLSPPLPPSPSTQISHSPS